MKINYCIGGRPRKTIIRIVIGSLLGIIYAIFKATSLVVLVITISIFALFAIFFWRSLKKIYLSIQDDGIVIKEHKLLWEEIRYIKIRDHMLYVATTGHRNYPNYDIHVDRDLQNEIVQQIGSLCEVSIIDKRFYPTKWV